MRCCGSSSATAPAATHRGSRTGPTSLNVREAGADDGVGAIVLEGAQDTFSAGSDMREWADAGTTDVERAFATMEAAFRAVEECPLPVVAAVEGVAAGAACHLALAADLAVMADSARIGMPIARLGILASPALAARGTDRVGAALAADLSLNGRLPLFRFPWHPSTP